MGWLFRIGGFFGGLTFRRGGIEVATTPGCESASEAERERIADAETVAIARLMRQQWDRASSKMFMRPKNEPASARQTGAPADLRALGRRTDSSGRYEHCRSDGSSWANQDRFGDRELMEASSSGSVEW